MKQTSKTPYQARAADEELIDVLTAISIVSMRLAKNIALLTGQSQSEEGGKTYGQDERYGYGHRRIKSCYCHY